MDYSEKLRSPKWQKRRLEILNRDNFTCTFCGDKETELQIHHLEYKKNCDPWDYDNSVLKTVCKHCHTVIEDYKKTGSTVVSIIKKMLDGEYFLFCVVIRYDNVKFLPVINFKDGKLSYLFGFSKETFLEINYIFNNQ